MVGRGDDHGIDVLVVEHLAVVAHRLRLLARASSRSSRRSPRRAGRRRRPPTTTSTSALSRNVLRTWLPRLPAPIKPSRTLSLAPAAADARRASRAAEPAVTPIAPTNPRRVIRSVAMAGHPLVCRSGGARSPANGRNAPDDRNAQGAALPGGSLQGGSITPLVSADQAALNPASATGRHPDRGSRALPRGRSRRRRGPGRAIAGRSSRGGRPHNRCSPHASSPGRPVGRCGIAPGPRSES